MSLEQGKRIIVVGLGTGVLYASRSAQRFNRNSQITIIEKRAYDMFSPCGIPYAIEGKVKDFEELKHTVPTTRGITKLLQHEATKINRKDKKILIKNLVTSEESELDYDSRSWCPKCHASVDIFLPRNRWPLFVGGEQLVGPAVLFWSVLIIIVLVAFGLYKTGLTPLRFYQWFLLGIGMSMSTLAAGLVVSGWLIALDLREKAAQLKANRFNLVQVGLALLTLTAIGALVVAISKGLLGHPDMNIIGNGSDSGLLRWYQDVSDNTLPRAWVFSIPMLAYRIAMLAWALWISFWLVGILKWGWQQCTAPRIWYR